MGALQGNSFFFTASSASDLSSQSLGGRGDHIPSAKGHSCLVSAHYSDVTFLNRCFWGGRGTQFWHMWRDLPGAHREAFCTGEARRGFLSDSGHCPRWEWGRNWEGHLVTARGASQRAKPVHRWWALKNDFDCWLCLAIDLTSSEAWNVI